MFCLALRCGCACPWYGERDRLGGLLADRSGLSVQLPVDARRDVVIPPDVDLSDGLSQAEAVRLGMQNNAQFHVLLTDLETFQAAVIEADQVANPQLMTLFPLGVKQWELALRLPIDALWLRSLRVSAANLQSRRVTERLVQDGLNVVRDIRVAYINHAAAQQQLEVARQGAKLRQAIAAVAEARWRAGAISELDASAMRLDALASGQEIVERQGQVSLTRDRLRTAMGTISLAESFDQLQSSTATPPDQLELSTLVEVALAQRPDLGAIQIGVFAAQQVSELSRHNYLTVLGILPDLNGRGLKGLEAGPGLQLNLPIFHQNQGAIARANASWLLAERQLVAARDSVRLEVGQAYTQLQQAQQALTFWQGKMVPVAEKSVGSARRALQEDAVSLLIVLEATRQLQNARQRKVAAWANVQRSIAELERSIGGKLDSLPGKNSDTDVQEYRHERSQSIPNPAGH